MRFVAILLFLFFGCCRASDGSGVEPSPAVTNEESFFPVASVEENSIEVNKTRYKLDNITMAALATPAGAGWTLQVAADARGWPDRMSLLHPNFWTYWIHGICQIIAVILALYCPVSLLVVLVVAVLCWPLSAIMGEPIWAMQPGAADWWLMAAKSMIVNICPTVPMMLCLVFRPSDVWLQRAAIWTYGILWANVAWTLCFLAMAFNAVSATNGICGISLCTSLIIHNVAICRRSGDCNCCSGGATLFELCGDQSKRGRESWKSGDVIYGYGTSLSWLVCYTIWNALFVVELAVGLTLQDIAFWAMMIIFYYVSGEASGLENYFAMARPISLSMYIATSDWPGLLNYFRGAEPLGLDVTSHAFFLFLAVANVLYSFYVLYWELCLLNGCGGADDYFKKTFKNQKLDEAFYEGFSEDYDEEEEDMS